MSTYQCPRPRRATRREGGLSLVELLVSMTLGLIVMTAIGYIYSGSRQSYVQQDNLARMQESGRYSLELLGQELRMAGYIGCPNIGRAPPAMQANNAAITTLGYGTGLTRPVTGVLAAGITNATTTITANQVANTDLLVIHRASGSGFPLSANMANVADTVQFTGSPRGLENGQGDILVISDCTQADIFCASTVAPATPNGTEAVSVGHGGGAGACNNTGNLSKAYLTNAMVMGFESTVYYIRNQSAGNPSLYRTRWAPDVAAGGDTDEVLPDVESMRVSFGLDTNNDGSVDQYVRPGAGVAWEQVRAVRVSLLVRSPDAGVAPQPQSYVFDTDGDGVLDTVPATDARVQDRRIRQVYTTTVSIRNRGMGGV